jgi:uncharacterized small protein (DUF1192 family)
MKTDAQKTREEHISDREGMLAWYEAELAVTPDPEYRIGLAKRIAVLRPEIAKMRAL